MLKKSQSLIFNHDCHDNKYLFKFVSKKRSLLFCSSWEALSYSTLTFKASMNSHQEEAGVITVVVCHILAVLQFHFFPSVAFVLPEVSACYPCEKIMKGPDLDTLITCNPLSDPDLGWFWHDRVRKSTQCGNFCSQSGRQDSEYSFFEVLLNLYCIT